MESISSDEALLVIDEEERNIKNFKAVYHQMNSKADSITKLFTDNVIIDLDAINNLNDMIVEKLQHYKNAGFIINVTVKYKDKKNKFYKSWQQFMAHRWTEEKSIKK